jgi:HAD superfamily hydrolase (TIGR01509 family)
MSKFKAILFDLGGTLLHLDYPFFQAEYSKRGVEIDQERFFLGVAKANRALDEIVLSDPGSTDASRWKSFFESFLREVEAPFSHPEFIEEVLRPQHQSVNLWNYTLPGTHSLLEELNKTYRLALISNSDGRAEAKTVQYGLRKHLEFVLDSHDVGVEKPDPRIFQLACERLGLSPGNCLYVGDIYSLDVLGPKRAGITPVLLDWSLTPRTDCDVLSSIFELPSFLSE